MCANLNQLQRWRSCIFLSAAEALRCQIEVGLIGWVASWVGDYTRPISSLTLFSSNDISGSTINLKLKLCTQVKYGGRLMSRASNILISVRQRAPPRLRRGSQWQRNLACSWCLLLQQDALQQPIGATMRETVSSTVATLSQCGLLYTKKYQRSVVLSSNSLDGPISIQSSKPHLLLPKAHRFISIF